MTNYYDRNAIEYIKETIKCNMDKHYSKLQKYLSNNAKILDVGFGSGRDMMYFQDLGYEVEGIDTSKKFVEFALNKGLNVKLEDVSNINYFNMYDAIWASASLIHIKRENLGDVLKKCVKALKIGGVIYCSFKYGDKEIEVDGRYFNYINESIIRKIALENNLNIIACYKSKDVRIGRENELWLNVILNHVPDPSVEEVVKYLKIWDSLENYTSQEKALNKLFFGDFKENNNLDNILIKCSVLNDFYSTNIFDVYTVAKHILSLDIDDSLNKGDPFIVEKIANVLINKKEKHFYSFSTKYCSHHNPHSYPIYDSYVEKVLKYFRKRNPKFNFKNEDLKKYDLFKETLINFQKIYGLEEFNLKDLDRYLWQLGKNKFPNKY